MLFPLELFVDFNTLALKVETLSTSSSLAVNCPKTGP